MPTICFYCVLCGTALHASSESPDDLMKCHACTRHVPVPKLASLLGHGPDYLPVFPPEVLDLTVAFQCTKCRSRLRADARWEGRGTVCPDCGAKSVIPRWSRGLRWARASEAGRAAPMPLARPPVDLEAAMLSSEEVDFLSGRVPDNSGAAG